MSKALTFGALNLLGTSADLAADGYCFEALAQDTEWGNAVPIDQQVESWLQDGAIVARSGYGNRPDMVVRLRVRGTDANYLALAEQQLVFEVGKPNTLTWTPPGVNAQPCVFSVVMSTLEHSFDDLGEVRSKPERIYLLRIQAEPFARSQTLVTATKTAPSGSQTVTSVDTCSSFTGWSGSSSGAGTSTSGTTGSEVFAKGADYPFNGGTPYVISLTRTGLSASISSTPYVRIKARVTGRHVEATKSLLAVELNGVAAPVAYQNGTSYWFDTTGLGIGTTLTSVKVSYSFVVDNTLPDVSLLVDDISRSNLLGDVGTKRQNGYTFEVDGSARTQASLRISDGASTRLDDVLVYTYPARDGLIAPNLRARLIAGPTITADATTVSGSTSVLSTNHTFVMPVTGLIPGAHLLLARVITSPAGSRTFTWSAAAVMNSAGLANGTTQDGTTTLTVPASYAILPIAAMVLPTRAMGISGEVAINVSATGSVTIDEAWLVNVEAGALSLAHVDDAAAGGVRWPNLWLDSPTISNPRPRMTSSTQADRSDEFDSTAEASSLGLHEFAPPAMNVFVVTSGSTTSSVTLSYHPRWHTHVAS